MMLRCVHCQRRSLTFNAGTMRTVVCPWCGTTQIVDPSPPEALIKQFLDGARNSPREEH